MPMKNTKKQGKLRFIVFKSKYGYEGICLEIDERVIEKTMEKASERIFEVAKDTLKMVAKGEISEKHLNERALLKYYFLWYFGALLSSVLNWRDLSITQMSIRKAYGV